MSIAVIILAAGQGTRMLSAKPKVLHELAGRSLLTHVLSTVNSLSPILDSVKQKISIIGVVHGHQGERVITTIQQEQKLINNFDQDNLFWVNQEEQLGTGHAVKVALENLESEFVDKKVTQVLVLYGDVPLVDMHDLKNLLDSTSADQLGLITLNAVNPLGLGRIIRNNNHKIMGIIEEKDANQEQKLISEINTGIFLLPYPQAKHWLGNLTTNNKQQEYYLTDIVKSAVTDKYEINSVTVSDQTSYHGINNLYQLAQAERHYQNLLAIKLLDQGVKIIDPKRIDIRGTIDCSKEVYIDINCVFEGKVKIGANSIVEPNCILRNAQIGDNVHIKANSIIEDSIIGSSCVIGPFARIRPETNLASNVHIGNFVEVKKSNVDEYSKINHLAYIGDTDIGKQVNVGAGTITCNYDGVKKHKTIIGDNAFIGSNSALVAPVVIGNGATIGAGSTICKDVPDNKLSLARSKQTTIEGWQRKEDKEKS